jgi:hypothetical protein
MATVTLSSVALAQNIRGSATAPTTAPGYDRPDQYIHIQDVKPADNMYPVVQQLLRFLDVTLALFITLWLWCQMAMGALLRHIRR